MPSSTLAKVKRLKKLRDEKRARRLARRATPTELPKPQPKQQQLIDSTADIVIFGGSAGGGKSSALLLDFAKPELLSIPGYSAVIFRRTYPMIRNEGGLWDESNKFYPLIQGEPLESRLEWRFPNNQTIRFAHLQHEKNVYDWQGSQLARIGFDELVHFTETQFWYLLGRARTTLPITPQVRATCNPDADSWVAKLIDWWIGDDGLPIHARSGVLRWFVRVNGVMRWSDNPDQLIEEYPNTHPKSLTFIPSLIHDNQALLKADPGYLANLEAQHPIERARLLDGNWKVKFDQGKIFNRSWFEIVDELPTMTRVVRFWDLAATAKAVAKNSSYYTAGVKIGVGIDGNLYVLDVVYQQKAASEVIPWIAAIAQQDGKGCPVRWELEGGSSGKIVEQYMRQALLGFNALAVKPMGDKLARALDAAVRSWLELANQRNGHDNASVVMMDCRVSAQSPQLFEPTDTPPIPKLPDPGLSATSRALLYPEDADIPDITLDDHDLEAAWEAENAENESKGSGFWGVALTIALLCFLMGGAGWLGWRYVQENGVRGVLRVLQEWVIPEESDNPVEEPSSTDESAE